MYCLNEIRPRWVHCTWWSLCKPDNMPGFPFRCIKTKAVHCPDEQDINLIRFYFRLFFSLSGDLRLIFITFKIDVCSLVNNKCIFVCLMHTTLSSGTRNVARCNFGLLNKRQVTNVFLTPRLKRSNRNEVPWHERSPFWCWPMAFFVKSTSQNVVVMGVSW